MQIEERGQVSGVSVIRFQTGYVAKTRDYVIKSVIRILHTHPLTDKQESRLAFAYRELYGREGIVNVECQTLLKPVKNRVGGPRL